MLSLRDYSEYMDVELPIDSKVLPIKAIKTDAKEDSLKLKLGLNCIKSCDYISFRGNSTLTLIECSDLDKQKSGLEEDLNNLITTCLDRQDKLLKSHANKVRKKHKYVLDNVIESELSATYKDTLLLVNKIAGLANLNVFNRFKNRNFVIITNKLNTNNPQESIALDQYKRSLELNLKSGLSCIVNKVEVLTPNSFIKKYSQKQTSQ